MAIEYEDMREILISLKDLKAKGNLLILGDATLFFDYAHLKRLADETGYTLEPISKQLDIALLGKALGFQCTEILDINGKGTITLDLQKSLPEYLKENFDCIIDAGVLHWIFNPGEALANIHRMLKTKGYIIHIAAISGHYGRGYYNIHPLLLERFYQANHCDFIRASFRTKFRFARYIERLMGLLNMRNTVTYSINSGSVFLNESRLNKIGFAQKYRSPREANIIPNNAVGIFTFNKIQNSEPVEPAFLCLGL